MLRVIVAAVLMLSMAIVLTAQNEELSREELNRRREQLKALERQIIQETGFQGRINKDPRRNRITRLEGHFAGITVPAREDTLGFKQAFEEIFDRIIDFFPVNREDLEKQPIRSSVTHIRLRYEQKPHGYSIEGRHGLNIRYRYRQEIFIVNHGLEYFDFSTLPSEPAITKEEAINIAIDKGISTGAFSSDPSTRKPQVEPFVRRSYRFPLLYSRENRNSDWGLYWRITLDTIYYVNSVTGRVDYTRSHSIE